MNQQDCTAHNELSLPLWFECNPWIFELLSPIAIIISALGAWLFAYLSIRNARKIAIKKSTFDYLSKLSWDKDYITAKQTFLKAKLGTTKLRSISEIYENLKAGTDISQSTSISPDEIIRQHAAIKHILNEYEALAIAIKEKALDENMIRSNIHQQFIDHIDNCKDFIEHTRRCSKLKHSDRLWCEVQALADKWRKLL